ncbi:unnamed protein product [Vitrella brassicaformis CCMP3155]|uniref:Uncharacterized protein n=3 Tax=Vitrella brassicaformis TaxID=1169539 RepID=A0A0G4GVX9_VITBC|nr:unnamed protein product [Vitrella brassicaformis CCMP3155]|eukprot:CEM34835.1 unnamed protein product [Vitrella brassicaformis CCMP3155]
MDRTRVTQTWLPLLGVCVSSADGASTSVMREFKHGWKQGRVGLSSRTGCYSIFYGDDDVEIVTPQQLLAIILHSCRKGKAAAEQYLWPQPHDVPQAVPPPYRHHFANPPIDPPHTNFSRVPPSQRAAENATVLAQGLHDGRAGVTWDMRDRCFRVVFEAGAGTAVRGVKEFEVDRCGGVEAAFYAARIFAGKVAAVPAAAAAAAAGVRVDREKLIDFDENTAQYQPCQCDDQGKPIGAADEHRHPSTSSHNDISKDDEEAHLTREAEQMPRIVDISWRICKGQHVWYAEHGTHCRMFLPDKCGGVEAAFREALDWKTAQASAEVARRKEEAAILPTATKPKLPDEIKYVDESSHLQFPEPDAAMAVDTPPVDKEEEEDEEEDAGDGDGDHDNHDNHDADPDWDVGIRVRSKSQQSGRKSGGGSTGGGGGGGGSGGGGHGGGGSSRKSGRKTAVADGYLTRKPGVLMYKFEAVVGGQRIVRNIACLGSLTWYNLYRALVMSLEHEVEYWVNESTVPHQWELPDGTILPHTDFDYKNQSGSKCPRPDFDKSPSWIGTRFRLVYGAMAFDVSVEDVIVYEQRMEDCGAGMLNLHKWFPRLVAEGSVGVAPVRGDVMDEERLAMSHNSGGNLPLDVQRINRTIQAHWWNSNLSANLKRGRARDLPTLPRTTQSLSKKARDRLVRSLYLLPPSDFITQLAQLASSRAPPRKPDTLNRPLPALDEAAAGGGGGGEEEHGGVMGSSSSVKRGRGEAGVNEGDGDGEREKERAVRHKPDDATPCASELTTPTLLEKAVGAEVAKTAAGDGQKKNSAGDALVRPMAIAQQDGRAQLKTA